MHTKQRTLFWGKHLWQPCWDVDKSLIQSSLPKQLTCWMGTPVVSLPGWVVSGSKVQCCNQDIVLKKCNCDWFAYLNLAFGLDIWAQYLVCIFELGCMHLVFGTNLHISWLTEGCIRRDLLHAHAKELTNSSWVYAALVYVCIFVFDTKRNSFGERITKREPVPLLKYCLAHPLGCILAH